jgi:hypothetical protein
MLRKVMVTMEQIVKDYWQGERWTARENPAFDLFVTVINWY